MRVIGPSVFSQELHSSKVHSVQLHPLGKHQFTFFGTEKDDID